MKVCRDFYQFVMHSLIHVCYRPVYIPKRYYGRFLTKIIDGKITKNDKKSQKKVRKMIEK